MNSDLPLISEKTKTSELDRGVPYGISITSRKRLKRKHPAVEDSDSSIHENQSHVDTVSDVRVKPSNNETTATLDDAGSSSLVVMPKVTLLVPKEELVVIEDYRNVDDKIIPLQPDPNQAVYDLDMHTIARAHLLQLGSRTQESFQYVKREEEIRDLYAEIDWVRSQQREIDELSRTYTFVQLNYVPPSLQKAMQIEFEQHEKSTSLSRHRLHTRERRNFLKISCLNSYQRHTEHQLIEEWERVKNGR